MNNFYKQDYKKKIEEYNSRRGTKMRAMEVRKIRIKNTGFSYIKNKYDFEKACSMIMSIYIYCARAVVKANKNNPDFKGVRVGYMGLLTTGRKTKQAEAKYKDKFYKFCIKKP